MSDVVANVEDEVIAEPEQDPAKKRGFDLKAKEMPVSGKKITLLARQIAGLSLTEAYTQMALSEKRIAKTRLKQLIESAWYVAENHHNLDPTKLIIKEAWTTKDKYFFRRIYHSKSRVGIKTRPRTTLTIRLEEAEPKMVGKREVLGRYSGLMRHHWKRWKKLDEHPN